mmetsp:Transcript_68178/g.184167  ORF Transcript_68178/g.184167 Transcript_68178/m.184167 type:complete len:267 (-) Transcript_68178:26-826(-)
MQLPPHEHGRVAARRVGGQGGGACLHAAQGLLGHVLRHQCHGDGVRRPQYGYFGSSAAGGACGGDPRCRGAPAAAGPEHRAELREVPGPRPAGQGRAGRRRGLRPRPRRRGPRGRVRRGGRALGRGLAARAGAGVRGAPGRAEDFGPPREGHGLAADRRGQPGPPHHQQDRGHGPGGPVERRPSWRGDPPWRPGDRGQRRRVAREPAPLPRPGLHRPHLRGSRGLPDLPRRPGAPEHPVAPARGGSAGRPGPGRPGGAARGLPATG